MVIYSWPVVSDGWPIVRLEILECSNLRTRRELYWKVRFVLVCYCICVTLHKYTTHSYLRSEPLLNERDANRSSKKFLKHFFKCLILFRYVSNVPKLLCTWYVLYDPNGSANIKMVKFKSVNPRGSEIMISDCRKSIILVYKRKIVEERTNKKEETMERMLSTKKQTIIQMKEMNENNYLLSLKWSLELRHLVFCKEAKRIFCIKEPSFL